MTKLFLKYGRIAVLLLSLGGVISNASFASVTHVRIPPIGFLTPCQRINLGADMGYFLAGALAFANPAVGLAVGFSTLVAVNYARDNLGCG